MAHLATTLGLLLLTARPISAHGYIDLWNISDQNYTGYNPTVAPWVPDQGTISWPAWNTDLGPVYGNNVNSPDIICSINATNSKKYAAPIAAGATMTLHWTTWPDSHHGPIFTYLAACHGDCTTVDKQEMEWVKIAEVGQIARGEGGGKVGVWAADQLEASGGDWAVTIPASIQAGNYVLRHEILALHSAYDVGGAQFYPQCVNIQVTGTGQATLSGVKGTELYTPEDAGVHYNIYNDESNPTYPMPGPKLFTG